MIGVVGCGYWGRNLVRNFHELRALHSICDVDPSAMEPLEALYPGVRCTPSWRDLLADEGIKGVVIATPSSSHYRMAREALLSGKHVFVEKPMALRVSEGEDLVEIAKRLRRILMVGHLLEYHPCVTELERLIGEGELGKINYIYSNRLNLGRIRPEENILWSFAPHDISVILLLLGEMPAEVYAEGGSYLNCDNPDVTVTTMRFASGVNAHIFVSWLHPYKEQKLVVVGDRKMAAFDDVAKEEKLLLFSHRIEWNGGIPVPKKENAQIVDFDRTEPLRIECQHFLDCIANNQTPKTDGVSGLRVLKILEASQRSLKEKKKMYLDKTAGKSFYIHPSSIIDESATIGEGTKIWHFSHICGEAVIGKNCTLGQNVFVGRRVLIGDNVKIQNNVSIYEGVTLQDDVFCGPSAVFTNVINPRSFISRKNEFKPTLLKKGATVGANATIICGNTIGRYAFIGAGAVVTRDVPDYALVLGNPGRIAGWICKCGTMLEFQERRASCSACLRVYEKCGDRVERVGSLEGAAKGSSC